jgi:hypothetical protein
MPQKPTNEQTSKNVASVASKLLKTGKGTSKEIRKVAGSALTQVPNKKK